MRIIKEINKASCKISVFSWNDKYLIKFESGNLEQTYKVNAWDILQEQDLEKLFEGPFFQKVIHRFSEMNNDFNTVLEEIT